MRSHDEDQALRRALRDAIAAASKASGLHFAFDGSTTERPSKTRSSYQPRRYGRRWAPVLIAFSDPRESPSLGRKVIGRGGSAALSHGDPLHPAETYVSGQVFVDTPALMNAPPSERYALGRNVFEHELGHLLGLDHVKDPSQVMYPSATTTDSYGDGDLRGLALLGSGRCAADI